jgi:hypothetical protein
VNCNNEDIAIIIVECRAIEDVWVEFREREVEKALIRKRQVWSNKIVEEMHKVW